IPLSTHHDSPRREAQFMRGRPPATRPEIVIPAGNSRRQWNPGRSATDVGNSSPHHEESAMNTRLHASVAMALIGLCSVAITHQAQACGLNLLKSANGQWTLAPPAKTSASAARKMFETAGASRNVHAMPNPLQFLEPITGLYQVAMTAEGNGPTGLPDGAPVD